MNTFVFWYPGDQVVIWGFNVLLQASFVAAIALAIATSVRRNPAVRYWVLCSSLLLLLLSPVIASLMQLSGRSLLSVSMMHEAVGSGSNATTPELPLETPPVEASSALSAHVADVLGHEEQRHEVPSAAIEVATESRPPEATMSQDDVVAASLAPQQTATWIGKTLRVAMPPLLLVWLTGAVLLLARLAIGWCRLAVILRSAKPNSNASLAVLFEQVGRAFQLTSMPTLVLSKRVSGPVAAGLFRPRVVLPEGMVDRLTSQQLRDILVHEVAHVVRRDQVVVLLQNLVAAIFWLHPLARTLNRALAQAREEVCDNHVLAATDAPSYSRTLLALAQLVQSAGPVPGAVGMFTSRWKLEHRVAGLLDERRSRMIRMTRQGKTLVVALSLVMVTTAALGTMTLAVGQTDRNDSTTDAAQSGTNEAAASSNSVPVTGVVSEPDGAPASVAKAKAVVVTYPTNAQSLATSGRRLTAEEAASLEKQIEQNPGDVASRTKLLGYYTRKQFQNPSAREAKQRHVLWLILNAPESEVLAIPSGRLDARLDADAYSQGKKAWIDQLKRNPENLRLLEHSSKFFLLHDRELAKESLQKARSLDMDNPQWPQALGHLYSLNMLGNSLKVTTDAAGKALEQFEIAYKLSTGEARDVLLQYLAKVALAANQPAKAKKYAETMLSQSSSGWNYGNNIHHGNTILGRIALTMDDVEEAKERLVESGETPGSPQLNSFGPSMALAKELLQKGEKDVVLEYFELCSKFWKMGKARLDEWSAAVKDDKIPSFGANLKR